MIELNRTSALVCAQTSVYASDGFDMRELHGIAKIRIQAVRPRDDVGPAADPKCLPYSANTSIGIDPVVLWKAHGDWLAYSATQSAEQLWLLLSQTISNVPLVMSDVSSGSVALEVSGSRALDVFARDCSLDLEGDAVAVSGCAHTLMAQAPVTIHRATRESWRLFVERSMATHVWERLIDTASHARHFLACEPLQIRNTIAYKKLRGSA